MVPAVFIDRTFIQEDEKDDVIMRVSTLLAMSPDDVEHLYDDAGTNGRFQVATINNRFAQQITEQLSLLPGVEIVRVPERVYLYGDTLAHVVGHLGLPDATDLEERPELDQSVRIGKLGVEKFYDEFLQGESGVQEYRVRRGAIIDQRPAIDPVPGSSLVLTIDAELNLIVRVGTRGGNCPLQCCQRD